MCMSVCGVCIGLYRCVYEWVWCVFQRTTSVVKSCPSFFYRKQFLPIEFSKCLGCLASEPYISPVPTSLLLGTPACNTTLGFSEGFWEGTKVLTPTCMASTLPTELSPQPPCIPTLYKVKLDTKDMPWLIQKEQVCRGVP